MHINSIYNQYGHLLSSPFFYSIYNQLPNELTCYTIALEVYHTLDLSKIIRKVSQVKKNEEEKEGVSSIVFHFEKEKTVLSLTAENYGSQNYFTATFYFLNKELAQNLIDNILSFQREYSSYVENPIRLITQNGEGGLETKPFNIKIEDINVGMNYGEEFLPVYNKIVQKFESKDNSGIVLFHGKPGTGKTSLIKYIAKKSSKKVLFVPHAMAACLSNPNLISFLLNHTNSILIIEDAEKLIVDRSVNISDSIGALLNISDGILGDCLKLQIIATFNTNIASIDQALLRKGRLIAEYEFNELSAKNSNKLFAHLGKNITTDKPLKLTDIYNFDEEEFKSNKREAIGFRNHAVTIHK